METKEVHDEKTQARILRRLRSRDLARGVPICGFTGVNGAGKTTLAAQSIIHDLALGRRVLSTVHVASPFDFGRPSTEPILSLRQLLEVRDSTLFLDDVAVIFSSRSTASLPPEIVALLQTLRHHGNTVRWTAPGWMRCDNLIREVTQGLVNVWPVARKSDGETPWPRPRFVFAGLMDTSTGKTDETPTKVLRRRILVPTMLESWGAFDTHADTPLLGSHLQSGVCVDCGGSRTREKHSKDRHIALGLPWFEDESGIPGGRPAVAIEAASPVAFVDLGEHSASRVDLHELASHVGK